MEETSHGSENEETPSKKKKLEEDKEDSGTLAYISKETKHQPFKIKGVIKGKKGGSTGGYWSFP